MNYLVTGSAGFIGGNLVKELKAQGHEVFTWEKENYTKNWQNVISNTILWKNIETIFHVGAESSTTSADVNEVMFFNYITTKFLSDWAKQHRKKFIFSSSAGVYGLNGSDPITLYGWSKKIAEDYVTGNSQISLRYFNVYGPGEENKGKGASVAYQACLEKQKGNEFLLFPGSPRRDFVYIRDVIKALIHADDSYDLIDKKPYEVGSGESHTFEEALQLMEIEFKYLPSNPYEEKGNYQNKTCSDCNKWLPNWWPDYNLKDGIQNYLSWLKKQDS